MNEFNAGTKTALSILAVFISVAPLAAHSAPADATVSRQVSYKGIDLSTSQGAQMVYVRLKSAARGLCAAGPDPIYTAPSWMYRECIENALAKVIRNTHRPLMSQAFISDYGIEVAAQLGVDTGTRVAAQ